MKHFNTPLLELKNIRRFFQEAILDDVSLTIYQGEILGIIGRSGAGKTTLIRCINGLDRIDSGKIFFDGKNITQLNDSDRQLIQRRIAMIFQHFNLLSSLRVIDNVALPLKFVGYPKKKRRQLSLEMLDLVGLSDKASYYPAQLSGGQKQRVGIARALASNPVILLSDEATSALDSETTQSILELLVGINQKTGLAIVLITHEMEVIRSIATRILVLEHGRIVEEGMVKDVFARPQSTTARSLLQLMIPALPTKISEKLNPYHGQEAIIELRISGAEARKPFLNNLQGETGVVARIIQGGIDIIQGESLGHFFLAISAIDKKKLEKAREWLANHSDKSEVLGYVQF
ncbi:MAG: D-methionine transport system ATP-binding protein [Candidatus Tokpelaia sp. JSC188]|nr:MAG: D-methionine transport system ATP-binding protein [Candidatus Tokpelaia sp. JSC188]